MLYFEDLEVGQVFDVGEHCFTREEILEFAARYDPQPFHMDEDAAKASLFGGLIASGWHTTAVYMRLFVQNVMSQAAGRGSPGLDELRWKRPVKPGDTLRGSFTIIEKKPYRGDIGLIRAENRFVNQDGKEALTFIGLMLFAKRPT